MTGREGSISIRKFPDFDRQATRGTCCLASLVGRDGSGLEGRHEGRSTQLVASSAGADTLAAAIQLDRIALNL